MRKINIVGGSFDFILFMTILALLFMGLIMVSSASSYIGIMKFDSSSHFFYRQFFWAILGVFSMIFISNINYRFLKKWSNLIYFLSLVLMAVVLLPGIGSTYNGANRWINIGGMTFQPSELIKVALVIKLAQYISQDPNRVKTLRGWGGLGIIVGLIGILLVLQDHMSAAVIIASITLIMLIAGNIEKKTLILLIAGGLGLLIAFLFSDQYRIDRFMTYLNPPENIRGDYWQIVHSLYAIGSGKLFGLGIGQSREKYLYLPEPQNDYIFAILGEELGFIGCIIVIVLFLILVWRGIIIAMKCKDLFGSLLAVGIVGIFATQIVLNIAVVTSLIPSTGMPLPFFSYGGTALLINLASMGMLLNISRQNGIE